MVQQIGLLPTLPARVRRHLQGQQIHWLWHDELEVWVITSCLQGSVSYHLKVYDIYNYKPQQPRTTQQQPGYLCVCVFRQASRDLQASCTSLEFQEFSSGYFRSALKLIQQKLPLTEIWIRRKASIDSWTTGLYTPKANNPLQDVTQRDTHLPTTVKYF